MNPQLSLVYANARHQELLEQSARRGHFAGRRRHHRAALTRLAELEQASRPPEPVLLGVVMQRPIAALSLRDGSVIADPFAPTAELIELLRLRARQLSCQ